jgi:hypothetical protein
MSFFRDMFSKTSSESVALIDISAKSVAGGYVSFRKGELPSILYTRRLPIEIHENEPRDKAMLRALSILGNALISEGAPILSRHTGSGHAGSILVSVDSPWQETKVRSEYFERKMPFTFTKNMVSTALEKTRTRTEGKILADESIIGTILNGYETREPYGRKIHRATIIVLTSFIDKVVADCIVKILRELFHTRDILSIAGGSLRYQAIRTAFPHERDALILDSTNSLISIALVRNGLLAAVRDVFDADSSDTDRWTKRVVDEFTELAKEHPLPRTIFLVSQERESSSIEHTLNQAKLGTLWLSDNPPKIVPVSAGHITGSIRQISTAPPDLPLLLMALYWRYRQNMINR